MHDTRTPVKTMAFSVALNVGMCLILMYRLKIGGLALAASISATVNAGLLYYFLRKRIGSLNGREILNSFWRVLFAVIVMSAAAYLFKEKFLIPSFAVKASIRAALLFTGIAVSVSIYFISCFMLNLREAKQLFSWPHSSQNV